MYRALPDSQKRNFLQDFKELGIKGISQALGKYKQSDSTITDELDKFQSGMFTMCLVWVEYVSMCLHAVLFKPATTDYQQLKSLHILRGQILQMNGISRAEFADHDEALAAVEALIEESRAFHKYDYVKVDHETVPALTRWMYKELPSHTSSSNSQRTTQFDQEHEIDSKVHWLWLYFLVIWFVMQEKTSNNIG